MNPNRLSSGVDRRTLLSALAALPALSAPLLASSARAQSAATQGGFSFAAVGDTRPMMYLPPSAGEPDLVKFFTEMFGLVMPDQVAEEVVKKYVRMTFDPDTNTGFTLDDEGDYDMPDDSEDADTFNLNEEDTDDEE